MRGKLLRRPLPPVKVDRPPTIPLLEQCDQNLIEPINQYPALTSKDNLQPPQIQILDNDDSSITPLPRNPPPSRLVLKSESFLDISSFGKSTPNLPRSTEHVKSRSLFPLRAPLKLATQGSMISRLYKEQRKLSRRSNDLVVGVSKTEEPYQPQTKQIVYSKHTHQKITKLLAERYLRQPSDLKVLDIPTEELGEVSRRVPQRQLLIELAALIKDHMRETMKIDVQTVIQPMPRFNFGSNEIPETEIILYQQTAHQCIQVTQSMNQRDNDGFNQEDRLAAVEPKFFQGGKCTSTPFCISDENMATPTEVAILDTLVSGRNELNLKAHFISYVPDISFLKEQVTSLNISFNNFTTLPLPILQLVNLEVLKARDNPLSVIPAEIRNLKNLKTLIISFCLLTTFPPQFFELEMLQNLDLSYNKLHHLPSQIAHLRSLQALGLEGNQLTLLPATIMFLQLRYLCLKNNFTHQLFWQTTRKFYLGRKHVKSLKELSAVELYNHNFSEEPVTQIEHILLTHCVYCNKAIGSNGVYNIKIHRKIFGHTALLYLYETCSLFCMKALE